MKLTPMQKEALRWLGAAVALGLLILVVVLLLLPDIDLLSLRYSVL